MSNQPSRDKLWDSFASDYNNLADKMENKKIDIQYLKNVVKSTRELDQTLLSFTINNSDKNSD